MLFNSITFAIFFPIVFLLYWVVTNKRLKIQNALIVASSFLFYGWWDWRFLILMIGSASVDFFVGIQLEKNDAEKKRKQLLFLSIFLNLGILGFFKYYNFFADNFIQAFSGFGIKLHPTTLKIILPVGISFYTFQALSYTIDVYKRRLIPTHSFVDYFAFISFFPQLVAGPIERATDLLPQFYNKRVFDYEYTTEGLRFILWGLFKKIVIADTCAQYADLIFNNSEQYSGATLLLGAVFFTFQIYCDFSGYSDIAVGTARLLGFKLMRNFAYPYFSRDIAEFWRRWHISLSTWFRDYVYVPLGGSRVSVSKSVRNTFIIFIVSGLWHGANWTFILWGIFNAFFFLPLLLKKKNRKHVDNISPDSLLPSLRDFLKMSFTFSIITTGWIIFRAANIHHAYYYLIDMYSGFLHKSSFVEVWNLIYWQIGFSVFILLSIFVLIEWLGRFNENPLSFILQSCNGLTRFTIYIVILATIFVFAHSEQQFIYFQF